MLWPALVGLILAIMTLSVTMALGSNPGARLLEYLLGSRESEW